MSLEKAYAHLGLCGSQQQAGSNKPQVYVFFLDHLASSQMLYIEEREASYMAAV